MNQQNPQFNPAPKRFEGIHTISEKQFEKWTKKWEEKVGEPKKLIPVFQNNDNLTIRKIYFSDETVINLISSLGVENIKARFAIMDDYAPYEITRDTFTIILFATDNQGNIGSAYHVGLPEYQYDLRLREVGIPAYDEAGYISDLLAAKWINGWMDIIKPLEQIEKYEQVHPGKMLDLEFPQKLFVNDSYGALTGYNYIMRDFMDSLYPKGVRKKNYDVIILLAAHNRIDHTADETKSIFTFGLVVAGMELKNPIAALQSGNAGDQEDVNSYYDLSLPTPPNQ